AAADFAGPADQKAAADHAQHADQKAAADFAGHADQKAAADHAQHADRLVTLENPLSEKFAVLRPSLLPGLVDSAAHNRRRQQHGVRRFETGARFGVRGESRAVAAVWGGAGWPAHWSAPARPADFYDVKGAVEVLAAAFSLDATFEPAEITYLVPGKSAAVT